MDWDREQFESRLNAADSEDAKVKVYLRRKQAHHRPDGVPLLESPSIMARRYTSAKVAQSASATKSCIDSFISQGSLDDDELLYELEYGARSLDARHNHSFTDTPSQGSDVDDGIDNDQLREVEFQPRYDYRSDGAHRIGPIPDKARGDVATLLQSLRERRSKLWAPNMAMQFSAYEAASNVRDSRSSAGGRTHPAPPTALDRRLTDEEVLEIWQIFGDLGDWASMLGDECPLRKLPPEAPPKKDASRLRFKSVIACLNSASSCAEYASRDWYGR